MSNPNARGRKKGFTTKKSSIIDPLLGDYRIIIDTNCFNLIFTDPINKKEKNVGYYTQLNNALLKIVKSQTIEKKPTYTLKEYLTELETTLNNLKQLINHD